MTDRPLVEVLRNQSRRDALKYLGGLAGGAALAGCATLPHANRLAAGVRPIMLVHGAWHGGWCWEPTIERLRFGLEGLTVHSPSLKGLGERADELTADLTLHDQIEDMQDYIVSRDLRDLVLVGHSYGGMIITGLQDRIGDRVDHIVYLDALVPEDGESLAVSGQLPLSDDEMAAIRQRFISLSPDGVRMSPLPPSSFGVPESHPLYQWTAERLTPHPLRPCFEPIELSGDFAPNMRTTYIRCTSPELAQPGVAAGAARAQARQGWTYREIATGHDAMITAPAELAEMLLPALLR